MEEGVFEWWEVEEVIIKFVFWDEEDFFWSLEGFKCGGGF